MPEQHPTNIAKQNIRAALHDRLFSRIDASSLAVFRIGFGLIMLWEVVRYWNHHWIERYFISPTFSFKYYGFGWVQAWHGDGMYWHFLAMGILAICITVGFMYRLSAILFTLAFSYVFLLDQAHYLNHFYLVILFSALLIVVPAQQTFSIDAYLRPKKYLGTVPSWSIWLLRVQLEIILIYAGLVKINYDWLHLEPLTMWLAKRSDLALIGPLFTQEWAIAVAAYGVIALHLIGAPLLLWKKTRLSVFFIYFGFHTLNHFVFSIGIFPWFTLFATLLFFDPDWPIKLMHQLKSYRRSKNSIQPKDISFINTPTMQALPSPTVRNSVYAFLSIWITLQIVLPSRHWFYPGDVSWTEEGHRFAWQMKLRTKIAIIEFYVTDPENKKTLVVNPSDLITPRQAKKMSTRPDMILQFAHYLRDNWARNKGIKNPEIYVNAVASLNGRAAARLIDRHKNLARVERNLSHADWILPLTIPLHKRLADQFH